MVVSDKLLQMLKTANSVVYNTHDPRSECKKCGVLRNKTQFIGNFCSDCVNMKSRKQVNTSNKKLRNEIIRKYGSKCNCCEITVEQFLSIDHIDNSGSKHRKEIGKTKIYKWLKKNGFPRDNFQLLCFNCNIAKSRYGKCPHRTDDSILGGISNTISKV